MATNYTYSTGVSVKTYARKNANGSLDRYSFKTLAKSVYMGNDFNATTLSTKFSAVETDITSIKNAIGLGSTTGVQVVKKIKTSTSNTASPDTNGIVDLSSVFSQYATNTQLSKVSSDVATTNTNLTALSNTVTSVKSTANGAVQKTELYTSGKIKTSLLPDTVTGQLYFKGVFYGVNDTSLLDNSGNAIVTFTSIAKGDYYICAKDITTTDVGKGLKAKLTASTYDFKVGDWLVCSTAGTAFAKIDNTDAISSINGKTGAITLASVDGKDLTDGGNITIPVKCVMGSNGISAKCSGTTYTLDGSGVVTGLTGAYDGTTGYTFTLTKGNGIKSTIDILLVDYYHGITGVVSPIMMQNFGYGKQFVRGVTIVNDSGDYSSGVDVEYVSGGVKFGTFETNKGSANTGRVVPNFVIKFPYDVTGYLPPRESDDPNVVYFATNYYVSQHAVAPLTTKPSAGTYSSVSINSDGLVTAGGQTVVAVDSLTNSDLDKLVVGGIALIG